ncbi:hypothetical protein, partial [Nocardioides ultimimeridianus]
MSSVSDDEPTPEDSGAGEQRRRRGLVGRLRKGREEIPVVEELDAEDAAAFLRLSEGSDTAPPIGDDIADVVARRGPSRPSSGTETPEGDDSVDWASFVEPADARGADADESEALDAGDAWASVINRFSTQPSPAAEAPATLVDLPAAADEPEAGSEDGVEGGVEGGVDDTVEGGEVDAAEGAVEADELVETDEADEVAEADEPAADASAEAPDVVEDGAETDATPEDHAADEPEPDDHEDALFAPIGFDTVSADQVDVTAPARVPDPLTDPLPAYDDDEQPDLAGLVDQAESMDAVEVGPSEGSGVPEATEQTDRLEETDEDSRRVIEQAVALGFADPSPAAAQRRLWPRRREAATRPLENPPRTVAPMPAHEVAAAAA